MRLPETAEELQKEIQRLLTEAEMGMSGDYDYRTALGLKKNLEFRALNLIKLWLNASLVRKIQGSDVDRVGFSPSDKEHFALLGSMAMMAPTSPKDFHSMFKTMAEIFGHLTPDKGSGELGEEGLIKALNRFAELKSGQPKVLDCDIELQDGGPEPQGIPPVRQGGEGIPPA